MSGQETGRPGIRTRRNFLSYRKPECFFMREVDSGQLPDSWNEWVWMWMTVKPVCSKSCVIRNHECRSQPMANKLVSKTEKNQTHRCRDQTRGFQWGEGEKRIGNIVGEVEKGY